MLQLAESEREKNELSGIKFYVDRVVEIAVVAFVRILLSLLPSTSLFYHLPSQVKIGNKFFHFIIDIYVDINVSVRVTAHQVECGME